jgi:hypothetical protein
MRFSSIILILVLTSTLAAQPAEDKPDLYRDLLLEVTGVDKAEIGKGVFAYNDYGRRIIQVVRGKITMLATEAERAVLQERGYDVTTVMQDSSLLTLYKRGLYGPTLEISPVYHTYERILEIADSLGEAHPDMITRRQIGNTTEGREIYAFRFAAGMTDGEERPTLLFDGCHHSDEIMGAQISTAVMSLLADGYGQDPEVTRWLDQYEIWVVPVVNVDGHHLVTHNIDPRWRKNTRDTNGNGILHEYPEGVDLNRNYDWNWSHGGSPDSSSVRYRGPYPFSEPENRAMRSLAEDRRFLLSITYHSQGQVIYYPWSWRGRPAPDDKLLTEIAEGLAGSIKTMEGDTTYKAEYGAGTVGQSYPWLYGRYGTFDFIVETGRGSHVFPPEEVEGIVEANLNGVRYLLDRAAGPGLAVTVTDSETGEPVDAEIWLPTIDTEDVDRRRTRASGKHWRLLQPKSYPVHVSADGYETVIEEVEIADTGWTGLSIEMSPTE